MAASSMRCANSPVAWTGRGHRLEKHSGPVTAASWPKEFPYRAATIISSSRSIPGGLMSETAGRGAEDRHRGDSIGRAVALLCSRCRRRPTHVCYGFRLAAGLTTEFPERDRRKLFPRCRALAAKPRLFRTEEGTNLHAWPVDFLAQPAGAAQPDHHLLRDFRRYDFSS